VTEYDTEALVIVRKLETAEAWFAAILDFNMFGIAIAAIIKMIATTIKSSIRENPRSLLMPCWLSVIFGKHFILILRFANLWSGWAPTENQPAKKKGGGIERLLPQHLQRCDAYCRIVVSVQFGDVYSGVPVALNRITPEGSEQKARCPVVPVVIGVAVTT
jgi:hypothetical protein